VKVSLFSFYFYFRRCLTPSDSALTQLHSHRWMMLQQLQLAAAAEEEEKANSKISCHEIALGYASERARERS
jgi:hypothetical protein